MALLCLQKTTMAKKKRLKDSQARVLRQHEEGDTHRTAPHRTVESSVLGMLSPRVVPCLPKKSAHFTQSHISELSRGAQQRGLSA